MSAPQPNTLHPPINITVPLVVPKEKKIEVFHTPRVYHSPYVSDPQRHMTHGAQYLTITKRVIERVALIREQFIFFLGILSRHPRTLHASTAAPIPIQSLRPPPPSGSSLSASDSPTSSLLQNLLLALAFSSPLTHRPLVTSRARGDTPQHPIRPVLFTLSTLPVSPSCASVLSHELAFAPSTCPPRPITAEKDALPPCRFRGDVSFAIITI
ncbi:hypothetical protein BHE74_00013097 [Ensete ventricosum]|nr:hypothetical protein BHE74_00013097 [Ensete ventricosum]RZR92503.1 hypothetical protein BHM03_00020814 [Ensete ventricosum]